MSSNQKQDEVTSTEFISTMNPSAGAAHDQSSLQEISIIDNLSLFLQANSDGKVDSKTLRNMAEALTLRVNDTSPGTLQDVTMDNSYGAGYRSPYVSLNQYQGNASPSVQGRSVREFEEQMTNLRKENFNLKLRLYFLEESIPGYQQANSSEGQNTLLKQIIDSKVENEMLCKEMQEKQELLKDAAQAMTHLENIQKDNEIKSQTIIDELKQKVQILEMDRDSDKSQNKRFMHDFLGHSDNAENANTIQRIRELEGFIKQCEQKMKEYQDEIGKSVDSLFERDETIKEYEEKVKELAFQNSELLEALENKEKDAANYELQRVRDELLERKVELADKTCMLQDAQEELEKRMKIHDQSCRSVQKLLLKIKRQNEELQRLQNLVQQQSTNATTGNVENTDISAAEVISPEYSDTNNHSVSDTEVLNESSPRKQQKLEAIIKKQATKILNLEAEIKKKTANLQTLVNKELWEKNREIERLTQLINKSTSSPLSPPTTSASNCTQELQQSFSDVEYAKAVERNRLLQKKVDILIHRLGDDKSNEAIIGKLRSELTEARSSAEIAEKWRRECVDVCTILSNRLEELACFLNSLLKQKDVLGLLAADRRHAIRKAVDRSLDFSKSLNISLSCSSFGDQSLVQLCNLSEILGEYDRSENITFNSHEELDNQQSIETLAAENKALKKELEKRRSVESRKERRSLPLHILENQSESEAWSEPDRKVSMARIGLEESTSLPKEASVMKPETDSENEITHNQSRSLKSRTQERIQQLEEMIGQRDNRILDIQCLLVEADNRLKKENLRVLEMSHELEQLRKRKEELEADLIALDVQDPKPDTSMLLIEIEGKTQALIKLEEERNRMAIDAREAKIEVTVLQEEMEEMKLKHEIALTLANEGEKQKLEELRKDMENIIADRLHEKEICHQEILQREYIARTIHEEILAQLSELQRKYNESENTIDDLYEKEQLLRKTVHESELQVRSLQKQLDEDTLQASKAIMERTKVCNEKLQLEKQVCELEMQLNENETIRNMLQEQLKQLERVNVVNEKKIKENIAKILNTSDVSQSGYTSEEVPTSQIQNRNMPESNVNEQRLNNLSPDLGIESDPGRISSMEFSNAQRPLLKTVELSTNIQDNVKKEKENNGIKSEDIKPNNLLQEDDRKPSKIPIHDCVKVEEENADLRRKLIQSKRSFEATYEKIRIANQRKAQVERGIKNQILKTHNVLKNVRSNMENEL